MSRITRLLIAASVLAVATPALAPAQYFQLNKEFGTNGTWSGGYQRFFISAQAAVWYLSLNVTRPAFSNALVRQAVNYAIDRPAIAQTSGYGAVIPAEKYLPPQIAGSAEEKVVYPVDAPDLAKAKDLMTQSGVATPITAVLYTCNQPPCPDRAAVIQQNLKAIGINVDRLFSAAFALGCALAAFGGAAGYAMLPLEPTYPFKYLTIILIVLWYLASRS